jgi:Zn-dependent M28 family amino/carboxypeptidase
MTFLPKRPAPRAVPPAIVALVAAALGAPTLFAQSPHNAPPPHAAAPAEVAHTAADLQKAIADLGDSPIAAILEAAGPDAREFNDHVTTLANPFFEGRVPGVRGNSLAADYIEWYFKRAGLQPAFPTDVPAADGTTVVDPGTSYRQPFQAGTSLKVTAQSLSFGLGGGGTVDLTPGKDFTVLGTSGNGKVSGKPVFVGYSITENEDGDYSSYPDKTDLTGKVAIVLRFEPLNAEGHSKWTKGGWSPASALDDKLKAAADRGAAAIIVVNPPGADDPRVKELATTDGTRGKAQKVPVVMVTQAAADKLIRGGAAEGSPNSLQELRKAADEKGGVSDLPGATVTLETAIARDPIMTANIGGVIPGKGALKDQYVILGAHYDHVGYGPIGVDPSNQGKLHPGADDNASGTSALLVLAGKLARTYADLPADANARSVLLLAFSAEESGLVGSHFFVSHPSIKPEQISLMINMDMVGRLRTDPPMDVEGTESAAGFYDWLAPFFETSGIKITHGSNVAQNSDHASFYNRKIPVLFFFTGYHKDYHKPGDLAAKINQVGAARIIALVHDITLAAAKRSEPFVFAEPKKKDEPAAMGSVHGTRVRFGIAPGKYGDDDGVLVGDVSDGTSASEAGIKPGDRLIKWNGKKIEGVESWMPMLSEAKPGDVVDVTVIRDGKEQVIKVTLKAATQSGR